MVDDKIASVENCVPSEVVEESAEEMGDAISSADSAKTNSLLSKGAVVQWQETLIQLVAAQHKQIAELAKQTKIAMSTSSGLQPTPNQLVASVEDGAGSSAQAPAAPGSGYTTFKLTSYDPDDSAYAIHEWLEDATRLKDELNVTDNLMIAKASEALKNRGNRYCCDWRPIRRTWENFCADLITAFPDKETPGARAFRAATLRSRDCDSLCDYGNEKLRSIHRFYDNLPWDKVLSIVEYGLDHAEARASLHIQLPQSERDVMTILSEFDARRNAKRALEKKPRFELIGHEKSNKKFKATCFKCGRIRHRQDTCRSNSTQSENGRQDVSNIPSCIHCKKNGHTEANCWFKNGRPKKTLLLNK